MRTKDIFNRWIHAAMILSLLAAPCLLQAQGPAPGGTKPDALMGFKRALEDAAAPPLTTAQEDKINALVTAYRDAHRPSAPGSAVTQAHREYDLAILNQDSSGAAAQAEILSDDLADRDLKRRKDEANLAIDVVKELRTNGEQLSLLQKRIGSAGVVRLVLSLVHGPGGPGGPGPLQGPRFRP